MTKLQSLAASLLFASLFFAECNSSGNVNPVPVADTKHASDSPEYFLLRPKLEKEYGYSHAVRIGDDLKISGAVSMNDSGIIRSYSITAIHSTML